MRVIAEFAVYIVRLLYFGSYVNFIVKLQLWLPLYSVLRREQCADTDEYNLTTVRRHVNSWFSLKI